MTVLVLFSFPAITVANRLDRELIRLKFNVLLIYIAVRGFVGCSSWVHPVGYTILLDCKKGSCSSAINGACVIEFISSVLACWALWRFNWIMSTLDDSALLIYTSWRGPRPCSRDWSTRC